EEHSRQGAGNVTVRNVITSMRLVSAVDWQELFESISLVDEALCGGSNFAEMDFATRDSYRHAIEELARGSNASELEVTRLVLAGAGVGNFNFGLFALLALVPSMELAVAVANRQFTSWIPAHPLPALELRDGVPQALRTMLVVPSMLTSQTDLEAQIEALEVHYLACGDGDFRFALLSDWADSATEKREGDDALLAAATLAIARLNRI